MNDFRCDGKLPVGKKFDHQRGKQRIVRLGNAGDGDGPEAGLEVAQGEVPAAWWCPGGEQQAAAPLLYEVVKMQQCLFIDPRADILNHKGGLCMAAKRLDIQRCKLFQAEGLCAALCLPDVRKM